MPAKAAVFTKKANARIRLLRAKGEPGDRIAQILKKERLADVSPATMRRQIRKLEAGAEALLPTEAPSSTSSPSAAEVPGAGVPENLDEVLSGSSLEQLARARTRVLTALTAAGGADGAEGSTREVVALAGALVKITDAERKLAPKAEDKGGVFVTSADMQAAGERAKTFLRNCLAEARARKAAVS